MLSASKKLLIAILFLPLVACIGEQSATNDSTNGNGSNHESDRLSEFRAGNEDGQELVVTHSPTDPNTFLAVVIFDCDIDPGLFPDVFLCGVPYLIDFDPLSNEWISAGPSVTSAGRIRSHSYVGGVPDQREFNIWGARFNYENSMVFNSQQELVGTITQDSIAVADVQTQYYAD